MSLRRDFALSLILGLRNVLFCVICSVVSTTFIIRDINIYRNSYSKGLLKSRESDHCCYNIKIVFKIHHIPPTTPPSLTETLKSQRLASLNYVDMSCIIYHVDMSHKLYRLILLKMAECFVVGFERNLCVITLTAMMALPDPGF